MKNPAKQTHFRAVLAQACTLAWGALLPAAAHAATAPATEATPGALLTLGVGLLCLLLRPGSPQAAYELFARDVDAHPDLPTVQARRQTESFPPRSAVQTAG